MGPNNIVLWVAMSGSYYSLLSLTVISPNLISLSRLQRVLCPLIICLAVICKLMSVQI